jgi:two-component system phosphate regulon sensor histidine kinase PhoR
MCALRNASGERDIVVPETLLRTLWRELRDHVAVTTPRHRRNALLFAQLPFALAAALLAIVLRTDEPGVYADPQLLAGMLVTGIATAATVVGQFARVPAAWLSVIPLIDIFAIILIRGAASDPHEDVGLFVIAPIIWLALLTPLPVMLLGFVGLELSVLYPLIAANESPAALYDWTILVVKPGLLMLLAIAVRVVASRLRHRQHQTELLAGQLQTALAASKLRESTVRTVLNSLTAGVAVFDGTGAITMVNSAAIAMGKLARLPLDDRPSGNGRALERANDGQVDVAALELYRPDRTTPVALEPFETLSGFANQIIVDTVYWIGPPGDQRAVVAKISPLGDDTDYSGGTVAIVYDVTNLIEAVRVRDEFVSTTSHELRTPLTSILGYLDLIDAPGLGIEMEVEVIERNAMRLLGMIGDLLDVNVQSPIQRREVDLVVLVGSAAGKRRADADAAGVTLNYTSADTSLTPTGPAPILAVVDAVAIARVVDNLLTNAIKFSRRGDSVTVTVQVDDAVAVIAVADTGVGISSEDQSRMFDQFFRTPSAQVESIPGTGLGLTVTQSILEAHDATVAVDSALGRGTTMTVTLPRWPKQLDH